MKMGGRKDVVVKFGKPALVKEKGGMGGEVVDSGLPRMLELESFLGEVGILL